MAPRPISERIPEPYDKRSVAEDVPRHQNLPDTPSPRTPDTAGSISPTHDNFHQPVTNMALIPAIAEPGLPYDNTLPQFIRNVTGENVLETVQNISLRVLTETSSLQQMTLYTPNLRELNLEGSGLSSLRDIGSELRHLQVLRICRCRLSSLDGTLGLTSLRELHASGNQITSVAPCAHLSHLRLLDLARNQVGMTRSLGFLAACRHLENVKLEGNPVTVHNQLSHLLQTIIPTLQIFDDVILAQVTEPVQQTLEGALTFEREDSMSMSSSSSNVNSRISSATSFNLNSTGEETSFDDD